MAVQRLEEAVRLGVLINMNTPEKEQIKLDLTKLADEARKLIMMYMPADMDADKIAERSMMIAMSIASTRTSLLGMAVHIGMNAAAAGLKRTEVVALVDQIMAYSETLPTIQNAAEQYTMMNTAHKLENDLPKPGDDTIH